MDSEGARSYTRRANANSKLNLGPALTAKDSRVISNIIEPIEEP